MYTPNQHLFDYLAYYADVKDPGFAVLVDGQWGSGKTHQVLKFLAESNFRPPSHTNVRFWSKPAAATKNSRRYLYVSLYGLSSFEQIDQEIVAAIYPWSGRTSVKVASAIGRALLRNAKFELPELNTSKLFSRTDADIFIFDDLERCAMEPSEVLGYLNPMVERDGARLIVIANSAEITDPRFEMIKEKLFGQTLQAYADFTSAYDTFCKQESGEDLVTALRVLQQPIHTIFNYSERDNLRILKRTISDFGRFFNAMPSWISENSKAMIQISRMFFSISFEVKSGNLRKDDLRDRLALITKGHFEQKKGELANALYKTDKKYPGVDFHDMSLSDDVLIDMFFNGRFDPNDISKSLEQSPWKSASDEDPAWKIVWQSSERKDHEVETAIERMLKEFFDGELTEPGDMLHSFGQILWIAEEGIGGVSVSDALERAKVMVMKARSDGKLQPRYGTETGEVRHGSYGGYGFAQRDNPAFGEFWTFLDDQQRLAAEDTYPAQAIRLLKLLHTNPDEFARAVSPDAMQGQPPVRAPILTRIQPTDFARALTELEPLELRSVLIALEGRYESGYQLQDRSAEIQWLSDLGVALEEEVLNLSKLASKRVMQNFRWTVGRLLSDVPQPDQ